MSISILVVDHVAQQRELIASVFEERGDVVRIAVSASEARMAHSEHSPDVAIISLPLADAFQNSLPSVLLDSDPHLAVVVLVEPGMSANVADVVHRGVVCLERPVKLEGLLEIAERAARTRRMRAEVSLRRRDTRTPPPLPSGVHMLIDLAARNADAPVLIVGEAGTGKTMVARLVHDLSSRSGAPFFSVDCPSHDRASLEAVLFGNERGVAADLSHAVLGLLEIADNGTVFLRSIGGIPTETQSLLLRFVEEGTLLRGGGAAPVRSTARLMVSSNYPLGPAVDAGRLRSDLFYRLQVLTIALPPLRDRIDDLERLATAILPGEIRLAPAALLALQQHTWPGNVRELEHVLWRAATMAENGTVELRHLALTAGLTPLEPDRGPESSGGRATPIRLAEMEKRAILTALETTGGNKKRAAKLLGIARSTLHDKLHRF